MPVEIKPFQSLTKQRVFEVPLQVGQNIGRGRVAFGCPQQLSEFTKPAFCPPDLCLHLIERLAPGGRVVFRMFPPLRPPNKVADVADDLVHSIGRYANCAARFEIRHEERSQASQLCTHCGRGVGRKPMGEGIVPPSIIALPLKGLSLVSHNVAARRNPA
jgi:hypothetical protein